jgi:hypothetical protein
VCMCMYGFVICEWVGGWVDDCNGADEVIVRRCEGPGKYEYSRVE